MSDLNRLVEEIGRHYVSPYYGTCACGHRFTTMEGDFQPAVVNHVAEALLKAGFTYAPHAHIEWVQVPIGKGIPTDALATKREGMTLYYKPNPWPVRVVADSPLKDLASGVKGTLWVWRDNDWLKAAYGMVAANPDGSRKITINNDYGRTLLDVTSEDLYRLEVGDLKPTTPPFGVNPLEGKPCPDCNANIGAHHDGGCDVERCGVCGGQRISCGCRWSRSKGGVWEGKWPESKPRAKPRDKTIDERYPGHNI